MPHTILQLYKWWKFIPKSTIQKKLADVHTNDQLNGRNGIAPSTTAMTRWQCTWVFEPYAPACSSKTKLATCLVLGIVPFTGNGRAAPICAIRASTKVHRKAWQSPGYEENRLVRRPSTSEQPTCTHTSGSHRMSVRVATSSRRHRTDKQISDVLSPTDSSIGRRTRLAEHRTRA